MEEVLYGRIVEVSAERMKELELDFKSRVSRAIGNKGTVASTLEHDYLVRANAINRMLSDIGTKLYDLRDDQVGKVEPRVNLSD